MILDKHILPQFFEIANETNSHYRKTTNTYDFIKRNSTTLCVTIGDSWTWGSDLTNRIDYVYGNQLSKMLDSDWLNLAMPGAGNHFIASKVVELNKIANNLEYDLIYVFCTFTEIGRQLDSQFDRHINYPAWYNKQNNFNFYNFLSMLNQDCIDIINNNSKKFKTIVRSNFVDPLGFEGKSWLSLLTDYNEVCYSVMHGLDNLVRGKLIDLMPLSELEKNLYKEWSIKMISDGEKRNKILLNLKDIKNYHPTTKYQHNIWAKELFGEV